MNKLLLSSLLTMGLAVSANAQLMIDFNSTTQDGGPTNQEGFQPYNAGHEVAADFVTQDYAAFGTTVSLTPSWNVATNTVLQMIDRGAGNDANYDGTMLDLVTDFIGIDARAASGGLGTDTATTMSLTLSGLPAGLYSFTSFHHDTENVNALFDVFRTDASGVRSGIGQFEMTNSTLNEATAPTTTNPGAGNGPDVLPSTVTFGITSDGSDVVIDYEMFEGANVHESIMGVNGFTLTVIPEPSTSLLMLGSAGFLLFRRRR